MDKKLVIKDRIRGSLVAGAAGDALGYTVEFWDEQQIFERFGSGGIQSYHIGRSGKALISDDTQMTLFTAAGLILGMHRQRERGISGNARYYVNLAYQDWLVTQDRDYSRNMDDTTGFFDFMMEVPELYSTRAPGMTCLSALGVRRAQRLAHQHVSDFIADRLNDSKGCGGVMRVAPLGLALRFLDDEQLAREGAQCAAITHSNSLGYMPAAMLCLIVNKLVYHELSLKAAVEQSRDLVARIYRDDPNIGVLTGIIDRAIALSENNASDLENIHKLGQGWIAEEALAIAVYCSLRHEQDLSKALIAAVNHAGDSDSTGAITGNILGALTGFDAIEEKWKKDLELMDFTLGLADRLVELFV